MSYYLHHYNTSGNPYYANVVAEYPGYPGDTAPPKDPLTVADLDAYFTTSLNGAAWAALTPEVQAAALAEAERWLGTLCWQQEGCCGRDFDAAYLMAISQLALALATDPTLLTATNATPGLYVSDNRLGELGQSYAALPSDNVKYGSRWPILFQKFPWLGEILGCWIDGSYGNSRILSRC